MRGEMVPDMGRTGHMHRAVFNREGQLRSQFPSAEIKVHIDDDYPRANILVEKNGVLARKEFFESAASLSALSTDDEYLDALGKVKGIAIHVPKMSYDGIFLVELVTDIHIKAENKGIKGKRRIDGFLFDFDGNEEQVA